MPCVFRPEEPRYKLPETLLSSYEIVAVCNGVETVIERAVNNRRRPVYHTVGQKVDAIRVVRWPPGARTSTASSLWMWNNSDTRKKHYRRKTADSAFLAEIISRVSSDAPGCACP